MLDHELKDQLKSIFATLVSHYTFDISVSPQHENKNELIELLTEVAESSDKIDLHVQGGDGLEFVLLKDQVNTHIKFRGIPTGHEFTSLLLAILNADGKGKNLPDETITKRVKADLSGLRHTYHLPAPIVRMSYRRLTQ
jgi:alkyl hydroperoxide reductase subunit F